MNGQMWKSIASALEVQRTEPLEGQKKKKKKKT